MNKADKIINRILFVIVALGILTYVLCLAFYREPTLDFTQKASEYLNQPLPIAGISILMIGKLAFTWFASTSYGQKQVKVCKEIAEHSTEKVEQCKIDFENYKQALQELLAEKEQEIKELEAFTKELCETIPNKKVKELLKEWLEHEREKAIDSKTEEE